MPNSILPIPVSSPHPNFHPTAADSWQFVLNSHKTPTRLRRKHSRIQRSFPSRHPASTISESSRFLTADLPHSLPSSIVRPQIIRDSRTSSHSAPTAYKFFATLFACSRPPLLKLIPHALPPLHYHPNFLIVKLSTSPLTADLRNLPSFPKNSVAPTPLLSPSGRQLRDLPSTIHAQDFTPSWPAEITPPLSPDSGKPPSYCLPPLDDSKTSSRKKIPQGILLHRDLSDDVKSRRHLPQHPPH